MTNLLVIPMPAAVVSVQNDCIDLLTQANEGLLSFAGMQKRLWSQWWDPGLSAAEIQARIDFIAGVAGTDVSGGTNMFSILSAKSLRLIAYILGEYPSAYDDAYMESTGARQPNGNLYQKFKTPGWFYTLDGTRPSGIAVSTPCLWNVAS